MKNSVFNVSVFDENKDTKEIRKAISDLAVFCNPAYGHFGQVLYMSPNVLELFQCEDWTEEPAHYAGVLLNGVPVYRFYGTKNIVMWGNPPEPIDYNQEN